MFFNISGRGKQQRGVRLDSKNQIRRPDGSLVVRLSTHRIFSVKVLDPKGNLKITRMTARDFRREKQQVLAREKAIAQAIQKSQVFGYSQQAPRVRQATLVQADEKGHWHFKSADPNRPLRVRPGSLGEGLIFEKYYNGDWHVLEEKPSRYIKRLDERRIVLRANIRHNDLVTANHYQAPLIVEILDDQTLRLTGITRQDYDEIFASDIDVFKALSIEKVEKAFEALKVRDHLYEEDMGITDWKANGEYAKWQGYTARQIRSAQKKLKKLFPDGVERVHYWAVYNAGFDLERISDFKNLADNGVYLDVYQMYLIEGFTNDDELDLDAALAFYRAHLDPSWEDFDAFDDYIDEHGSLYDYDDLEP